MEITDIKHGCYWLEKPVQNPHPDRRSRDWSCQPELPRGRYLVTGVTTIEERAGLNWQETDLHIQKTGHQGTALMLRVMRVMVDGSVSTASDDCRVSSSDHSKALLEALASAWRRDESPAADLAFAKHQQYVDADDVVTYLVEAGVLPQAALRVAIKAIADRQNAEADVEEAEREREHARARQQVRLDNAVDLLRRIRDGELADGDWREVQEVLDDLESPDAEADAAA